MDKGKIYIDPTINTSLKLNFNLKKVFGFKEEDPTLNKPRFMQFEPHTGPFTPEVNKGGYVPEADE